MTVVSVYFDDEELLEKIRKRARNQIRSLSREIIFLVKKGLECIENHKGVKNG